jgi:hypothetical protein
VNDSGLTPWARRALSPETRRRIRLAQPADARLQVGHAGPGWMARVMWRGECVAETYGHRTAEAATRAVLASGVETQP